MGCPACGRGTVAKVERVSSKGGSSSGPRLQSAPAMTVRKTASSKASTRPANSLDKYRA